MRKYRADRPLASKVTGSEVATPGRSSVNAQVPRRPIRIANCSGFYGDRMSAARDMLDGGPIDVLTGDYLGELTMLTLNRARERGGPGYARSFLGQMNQVMAACAARGVKVVANAGGLEPARLAADLRTLAAHLGVPLVIAHVEGDDLLPRFSELRAAGIDLAHADTGEPAPFPDLGQPVAANAYLGGWGIAEALRAGADIVVCPRVTDASLAVGPAAWWHDWARDDWDVLAGAVAAGHVIECGTQCAGGSYPFLAELPDHRLPGFPIAEIAADGSAVITKHPGTGGAVTVGTVTNQLLHKIGSPEYLNPDVTAFFDSLTLTQRGPDRVLISGARGITPTHLVRVGLVYRGGYRNSVALGITGMDVEAKAALAEAQLFEALGGRDQFAEVDVRLQRGDKPAEQATTAEDATAQLHITVKDPDPDRVGAAFTSAVGSLAMAGYSGVHQTTPPTREIEYGVHRPILIQDRHVHHAAVLPDGSRVEIRSARQPRGVPQYPVTAPRTEPFPIDGITRLAELGRVCGARSGDKSGNVNVGLWTRDSRSFAWLWQTLDVDLFRKLVPEVAELEVRRYELPNLHAVNFVILGLLGAGSAATARADPQARAFGEFVRSRLVEVPVEFLAG
jgi:hypothetical protein